MDLCVSTPSGSTAYNKALGGAIIHPSISAIQLTEMASINNRVFRTVGSPLILPGHHTCMLKPVNQIDFHITIDHLTLLHKDVKSIQFRVADERIVLHVFVHFLFGKGYMIHLFQIQIRNHVGAIIFMSSVYTAMDDRVE